MLVCVRAHLLDFVIERWIAQRRADEAPHNSVTTSAVYADVARDKDRDDGEDERDRGIT